MEFSALQIAELLDGEIKGNPQVTVNAVAKIEEGHKGDLSFLANPAYTQFLYTTEASVVIVNKDFIIEKEVNATLICVEDAYSAFAKILEHYDKARGARSGVEEPSFISNSADIGPGVYRGAFSYIGDNSKLGENVKVYPNVHIGENVTIGNDVVLFAGVKICSGTIIGDNCTLHMGVVVGSDGFGFAPNSNNEYKKVVQTGNVVIESNVEIGANTTIDRATLGSTIIRKGVKLDNLIQVAHNVEIGENTVIAAQTGIAGSVKIGKDCMIGGQVGLKGHITIADKVKIAAQSGIASSLLKEGEVVQGTPAIPIGEFNRSYVLFKSFPKLVSRIGELEKQIEALKKTDSVINE